MAINSSDGVPVEHRPHPSKLHQPSRTDHAPANSGPHGAGLHHHHHHHRSSSREAYPSPPPNPHDIRQSNSLSKDDQDIFLHAHFSSTSSQQSVPSPAHHVVSRGSSDTPPSPSRLRPHHHTPLPPGVMGEGVNPLLAPSTIGGPNFLPTLTQLGSTPSTLDATPLPTSGHAPIMEYPLPTHSLDTPPPPDPTTAYHEITQVTNSVHAPISSLTPLPNEPGEGYVGVFNRTASYKKDVGGKHGSTH